MPGAQYIPDVLTLKNGGLVSRRPNLNLIPGTNVTLNVTDNAAQDRVDIEIASTGGASATARYIDIRDGGAVPNGDSGAAINAVLAQALTEGKSVFIPQKDFIIETPVQWNGVPVFGEGKKSRLIAKAGLNAPVLTGTASTSDGVLENFCIDGNMAGQTSFAAYGMSLSAASRLRVAGMFVTNCKGHGIWGTGLSKSKFLHNQIYDTGGNNPANPIRGLWLYNTLDSLVQGNTIRGAYGFAATLSGGCSGVKVLGNDLLDSTTYDGLLVYGCKDITVSDNTIKNVADSGLVFELCEDVTANGNTIRNAWLCGIYAVDTMYYTLKGNTLRDNAIAANNVYSDISLAIGSEAGSRGTISGNTIISASTSPNYRSKYGIREHTGSDSNTITDNQFVGQVVAPMLIYGANTTQANNKYNGVTV